MTVPLSARLDEIEAALAKATPGPWEVRWQCPDVKHHHDWDEGWIAEPETGATVAMLAERCTSAPADAALIVAAVNALPELLATVRDLSDAIDKTRALADELDRDADVQNVLGAGNWKITHLIETAARLRAVLPADHEQPTDEEGR